MKVGESIYRKMFKIDVTIQQITIIIIIITIIIIPLYHIINNFLVVFWGKEKKSLFISDALVVKKQLIKLNKKQQMFPYQNRTPSHTYSRSSKFLLGCVHCYGTHSNIRKWVYKCLSHTVNLFLERGCISQLNHWQESFTMP